MPTMRASAGPNFWRNRFLGRNVRIHFARRSFWRQNGPPLGHGFGVRIGDAKRRDPRFAERIVLAKSVGLGFGAREIVGAGIRAEIVVERVVFWKITKTCLIFDRTAAAEPAPVSPVGAGAGAVCPMKATAATAAVKTRQAVVPNTAGSVPLRRETNMTRRHFPAAWRCLPDIKVVIGKA